MKSLMLIFMALLSFNSMAYVDKQTKDIHFSNKAQCARESKLPSDKIVIVFGNMELGRSLNRLSVNNNKNPEEIVKTGIDRFKYTSLKLLEIIHNKILNGHLPLLSRDNESIGIDPEFKEISIRCEKKARCPEMDEYISQKWNYSSRYKEDKKVLSSKKVDLSCSFLKKFSPIDFNFSSRIPNLKLLDDITKQYEKLDEFYSGCFDFKQQSNQMASAFEISFQSNQIKNFNEVGFDYWNSMKLYFSWAFRNSREMEQLAMPYELIFKTLAVEDSVYFVPFGCKSIDLPKCDMKTLSTNSMRLFSNHDFKNNLSGYDFLREIPSGVDSAIVENKKIQNNDDVLSLFDFTNSSEWANNFRKNFSESRSRTRRKTINAITSLNLINSKFQNKTFLEDFHAYFNIKGLSKDKKSELYVLCSQAIQLTNKDIGLVADKINKLHEVNVLNEVSSSLNVENYAEIINEQFKNIQNINSFCQQLNQNDVFANASIDKGIFDKWYYELNGDLVFQSKYQEWRKNKLQNVLPIISFKAFQKTKDLRDVVCIDVGDCSRVIMSSLLDLNSAAEYADIFLPMKNEVLSGNISNPYAERVACRSYDPWFKTKATLFQFGSDAVQALTSLASPGIIYGDFSLKEGEVKSFKKLVLDGKITIDPQYNKAKVLTSAYIDLGSMSDIPCSISYSRSKEIDPSRLPIFKGISFRTCNVKEANIVTVGGSSDINSANKFSSGCLQCSLEFDTLAPAVARMIPFGNTAFFMARAVVRLYKGLNHSDDVPRGWDVNPVLLSMSKKAYGGKLIEACVGKLTKGKACLPSTCAEGVVNDLKKLDIIVSRVDIQNSFKGYVDATLAETYELKRFKISSDKDSEGNESCRLNGGLK